MRRPISLASDACTLVPVVLLVLGRRSAAGRSAVAVGSPCLGGAFDFPSLIVLLPPRLRHCAFRADAARRTPHVREYRFRSLVKLSLPASRGRTARGRQRQLDQTPEAVL